MASRRRDKSDLVFNRLFVLGGKELTEDDWRRIFEPFGKVINVHMTTDPHTGQLKGITYISFSKTSECCIAVEEMNGKRLEGCEKSIKVIISGDKRAHAKPGIEETEMLKRLFIMYPKDQTANDAKAYFEQYGEVEHVRPVSSKKSNTPRNLAYVKFYLQSTAAKAYEECDEDYKPIFADIKIGAEPERESSRNDRYDDRRGGMDSSRDYASDYPGRGRDYDRGSYGGRSASRYDYDYRRGLMRPPSFDGGMGLSPMDVLRNDDSRRMVTPAGSCIVELCVSGRVSENHVRKLCDLIPGLRDYRCDPSSGVAYAEYISPSCAAYAEEKLQGFEYPIGYPLSVKLHSSGMHPPALGEVTSALNQSIQSLNASGLKGDPNVQALVETISRATSVLQKCGLSLKSEREDVPWCNIPLPAKKPFAPHDSSTEKRLFVVSSQAFPDRYLQEAFCRFGDLISAYFMPGKGFGYAKFAKKESADEAIRVLHGQQVCGHRLKVMEAEPSRNETGDYESKPKRKRDSMD